MNITKLFAISLLVTLVLFAGNTPPSGLSFHCDNGASGNGCSAGQVTFTGTNYPNHVHLTVTRMSDGKVYDDAYYQAPHGVMSFIEVLSPADTYSIKTTIHGGHETIDDLTITTQ